jgi:DNA repair protein RecO (recombination protein O)
MAEFRDRALLLRRIPYGDSSLVIHLLTESHGVLSLMARGARRAKSPLRAALEPLYELSAAWRSGRSGMGTLTDVERHALLLPLDRAGSGLHLVAVASALYREGDPHGFAELSQGLHLLRARPEDSGLVASAWQMLISSGWVGDLEHCWGCGQPLADDGAVFWHDGQLCCAHCCSRGMPVSLGLRRGMLAHLVQENVRLESGDVAAWRRMIDDVFARHGLRLRLGSS